ncbi:MAG: LysR family transcriptional regulator, partial [Verrucomicrobiota bacterium]
MKYFKAVAEELHFQRAARRVNITQPSLSAQIKLIEEELDVTLLKRDRKSVQLTKAGKVFLKRCERILKAVDQAIDETRQAAGQEKLHLKLGTRFFINLPIFANSVMATRKANPNITIEQIDMPTNEVEAAVKEGEIDIGFAPAGITHPALIVRKIIDGYFVVVMPEE